MKKLLTIATAFIALSGAARAQTLLQFNTFGNAGTETTEPSIFNDTTVTATTLSLGPGVVGAANTNRLGGNNWFDTGNTSPSTLANAIAGDDYIQFIVTPSSATPVTVGGLFYTWDRSGTGPSAVTLRSSTGGFATDLGTVTGMAAALGSYTLTVANLAPFSTAETFRLYGYGATGTTGTGGFDTGSDAVNVTISAVPEPSTYALLLVGLGLGAFVYRRKLTAAA